MLEWVVVVVLVLVVGVHSSYSSHGNKSLVMIVPYLTNDLVIDKKHEGQHQTNPKHQIRRFQQIFKINCDPHTW